MKENADMAAPRKTAVAQKAPVNGFGLPSERLQKLLLDTNTPEPYQVTDTIVVTAPTKRRRDELRDAQMRIAVSQQLLNQAMNHVLPARPEFPVQPVPPGPKGTAKQFAAYEAAVENFDKIVATWQPLKEQWEQAVERHQGAIAEVSEKITADSDRYTKALFGDAYDEVIAFFNEQPPGLWDAFHIDIQEHFRLITRVPEVPDDGTCPTCGRIDDEEQAGKAPASSA